MKLKPGLPWRPQNAEEALLKRAVNREWTSPRESSVLQSIKVEEVGDPKLALTSDLVEFGVCPAGFSLALVQYFLSMIPFLHFRMVMYILCYCVLEVCDLLFHFDFTRDYS